MYDVHNFPHKKIFFDISLTNAPSYDTFDFERKISKFPSEDSFFGGGESYVHVHNFPHPKIFVQFTPNLLHSKAMIQ